MWPEIELVEKEKRRELVLKGDELNLKVQENGGHLPNDLFNLELINFLEINSLGVKFLSEKIENLKNLSQLFLRKNEITQLPVSFSSLTSLKIVDLSENNITSLPDDIGKLKNLQTLNVAHNKLTELPTNISNLTNLAILDISQNEFEDFPSCLYESPVSDRLAELHASHNPITDIGDEIIKIKLLKVIDLSGNQLKELTRALGSCLKLKQTNFKQNPLKDKRMKKLIDQDNSQKSILDYIRSKGRPLQTIGQQASNKTVGKGARKKLKGQKLQEESDEIEKTLVKYFIDVLKIGAETDESPGMPFRIIASEEVKEVRPYIVGCVVRNLVLDQGNLFKNFITLQTRLHDELCDKRTIATIATHDLKAIQDSVVYYDAEEPNLFKIQPLGRKAELTALQLYQKLCKEGEAARKDKKRNQVSGIYKYLSLLKGKEKFALLRRSQDDCVISLPPLTNCDATKISPDTSNIFVEVTGNKSLGSCKSIMDQLLRKMAELGYYSVPPKVTDFYDDSSDEETTKEDAKKVLIVQQVRVEDSQGNMKVLYPSWTDLEFDSKEIKIHRQS